MPVDILTGLFTWLTDRRPRIVGRYVLESETHGNDDGHPTAEVCRRAAEKVTRERVRAMPAPEIGSGLLAGDKSQ